MAEGCVHVGGRRDRSMLPMASIGTSARSGHVSSGVSRSTSKIEGWPCDCVHVSVWLSVSVMSVVTVVASSVMLPS